VAELGHETQARALFDAARTAYSKLGARDGEAYALAGLGVVAHRHGQNGVARSAYEGALIVAKELGLADIMRMLKTNLGAIEECEASLDRAAAWYAGAVELIEAGRYDLPDERQRMVYLGKRLDPYERLVMVAWRRSLPAASWLWCEAGRSRALLDLLGAREGAVLGSFVQPAGFDEIRACLVTTSILPSQVASPYVATEPTCQPPAHGATVIGNG
jgi:hypothetical protein